MLRIGLVMLQGARHAHLKALNSVAEELQLDIEIFELRNKNDLIQCKPHAIILPGGESTTMRLVGNGLNSQLFPTLFEWIRENPNLPVLGTKRLKAFQAFLESFFFNFAVKSVLFLC